MPEWVRRTCWIGTIAISALVAASQAGTDRRPVSAAPSTPKHQVCSRIVAEAITIEDLKLVGIVGQPHRRSMLLMGPKNVGYFVKAGECIGREHVPFEKLRDDGEHRIDDHDPRTFHPPAIARSGAF